MSTIAKLRGADFDSMVARGAFNDLEPMKIELIYGELRFMNPAGPTHSGEISFLARWACANTDPAQVLVYVQGAFECGENRPEPDIAWFRKPPSRRVLPTHKDALLVIEVSDSSLTKDLKEKAKLYAEHDIPEYWIVDINAETLHVYRSPTNGKYQSVEQLTPPATIAPLCNPAATLGLVDLFDLDS